MIGKVIEYYPQFPVAILALGVRHLRDPTPFAGVPLAAPLLACLIHAANVHSEPDQPSICMLFTIRNKREFRRTD